MNNDQERSFRIRPPRSSRLQRNESNGWSLAFKRMMHIARMTRKLKASSNRKVTPSKPYM